MAARAVLSPNGRYSFSRIPKSQYAHVMSFMEKNFFPNETINKALNLFTEGTIHPTLRQLLRLEMEQDMSYMVVDQSTNTLIGAQLNSELSPAVKAERFGLIQELMYTERKWQALAAVYQKMFPSDIFKECDTDRVFEQHMCTFLPAYRGQGLFKISTRMSHETAVASGYTAELAVATADATNVVLKRLGFRVIREVVLRDIVFDGEPIIYPDNPDVKFYVMINDLRRKSSDEYFLV